MKTSSLTESNPLPANLPGLLLSWYDQNRRILPWREDPTPYHVWISEIMLQQTRVETVIAYYERFQRELPDVKTLAGAPEDRLLKLWEGLGYYSRVRNMQKAARQIMEDYDGVIPSDPAQLKKLSGIGPYTAAAIASIAYGYPAASVDGNLLRVYARLCAYREDISAPPFKKTVENHFTKMLPADRPGDMNQALMDLGATICLPNGAPLCERCPLCAVCAAHQSGQEQSIPRPKEKAARPVRNCTVLLIRKGSRVLLHRRAPKGLLAGLYEFPNPDGFLTEKEVLRFCADLGLHVKSIHPLPSAKHVFTHRIWEMIGYEVIIKESVPADGFYGAGSSAADRTSVLLPEALPAGCFFASPEEIQNQAALPSAFSAYSKYL